MVCQDAQERYLVLSAHLHVYLFYGRIRLVEAAATKRPMRISIVIPVYNEFRCLPQVLERVVNAPLPAGCEAEIIIVDDGSTDGTTDLLRQKYSNSPLMVVHHSVVNFGKGAAVRIGIAKATGSIIL